MNPRSHGGDLLQNFTVALQEFPLSLRAEKVHFSPDWPIAKGLSSGFSLFHGVSYG
jgi:hypothetical protein